MIEKLLKTLMGEIMYSNRRRERSTDNGIIYPMILFILKIINWLNIVEIIKNISDYFTKKYFKNLPNNIISIKVRRNRNIVIDLFIIFKFIFVIVMILNDYNSKWIQVIVWYLVITNIYTYFIYHLWSRDALMENYQTIHRVRRRFINLFVSILFMMLSYVYFYYSLIPKDFSISVGKDKIIACIFYSLTKSFAIDYDGIKSTTDFGLVIEISQVVNMFVFITILLAKSLPKADQE